MISDTTNVWNSPVRSFVARVEMYNGSALADAFTSYYGLKSWTVERVGEGSKFFGFGICQKLNLKLVDKDRLLNVTTEHSFKVYLSTGGDLITPFPTFYVTEVHRDENTNELSITAYDALYKATEHNYAELGLTVPYTLKTVANACSQLLTGNIAAYVLAFLPRFNDTYAEGGNFEGTETIRDVLDAIAEATQSIYYVDKANKIHFVKLGSISSFKLTITKDDYFSLDSKTNRRLATICHATELSDNVSASLEVTGTTQYVRDNPFWEVRDDIGTVVEDALAAIGGLTINQFSCSWRGNLCLEVGDKIELVTKDNNVVTSYVLNDVITYNGGLMQTTSWSYEDSAETESNPSSLGEALKKTFAKVDKQKQEIEIVAGEVTSIKATTDSISASVSKMDDNIAGLQSEVSSKMSAEDVTLSITKSLENGVDKVTTSTGFTFNEEGLKISKTDSELSTQITDDGMKIYKNDAEILTVNNQGVKAEDLHATTYLIIGSNSRIEDYGSNRTGCFWIGN